MSADRRLIDINDPDLFAKGYTPLIGSDLCHFTHMIEWEDLLDAPIIDAVEVVRCKDCIHRYTTYDCPMRKIVVPAEGVMHFEDATTDDGFCDKGKRRVANDPD